LPTVVLWLIKQPSKDGIQIRVSYLYCIFLCNTVSQNTFISIFCGSSRKDQPRASSSSSSALQYLHQGSNSTNQNELATKILIDKVQQDLVVLIGLQNKNVIPERQLEEELTKLMFRLDDIKCRYGKNIVNRRSFI
jgi:hypothetical protein